jgi:DNA invertase Pin-like site-specific DNA recombinase
MSNSPALKKHPTFAIPPENPTGSAWFLGRYSDDDLQKESSIDQQLLACREGARKNGHEIPDDSVFADAGVRGWKSDRPAISKLKELVKSGIAKPTDLYVFDTSRAFRDVEYAVGFRKFCEYHKIRLHFVANGMVSGTPGFNLVHTFRAVLDEEHSTTLGYNVKRGQRDQFEKGFYALARTYGYDHVDIVNPAYADSFDRRHRDGVRLVINPAQAEVIRHIFRLYRLGQGYDTIARHLNELGIRSPRRPTKNAVRLWGTSSVRTILANDRYTGIVRLGVHESLKERATDVIKHFKRPESEWRVAHDESIRIISDEDFASVQQIRKERDTLGVHRKTGGFNKAKGIYPWSGILECGECEGTMNIHQPNTYICSTAHRGGACSNKIRLNREGFQKQMLDLLVRLVRESRSFDRIVDSVMKEVLRQQAEARKRAVVHAEGRASAQEKLLSVDRDISNLVIALSRIPDSEAISSRLAELEAERKILAPLVAAPQSATEVAIDRKEVAEYLSKALENLADLLAKDPLTCRDEIRKRVKKLVLTPSTFEGHAALRITGDLRLFQDGDMKMLCRNVHIPTEHFRPVLNLTGLVVKLEANGKVLRVGRLSSEADDVAGSLLLAA